MRNRNLYLTEARSINDEYERSYSSIDRETFDKIIAMDPITNANMIGPNAKQLLLPRYMAGDTSFLEKGDQVKSALQKYLANRKDYLPQFRNLANFKSVDQFLQFVENPESVSSDSIEINNQPKKSKLEQIYDSYYKDKLSFDEFKQVVALDPTSTDNSIGQFAKNLFLNKYIEGEKDILNKKDEIAKAIDSWNAHSAALKDVNINTLKSVDDFIRIATQPTDSEVLSEIKNNFAEYADEYNYIGSDWKYDVFAPKTRRGSAIVAGTPDWDREDASWSAGSRGHWCTTNRDFWGRYSDGGKNIYYQFISREKPYADNRIHNFQYSIRPDGTVREGADGVENYGKQDLQDLLREDPDIVDILIKLPYIKDNEDVVNGFVLKEYRTKPFIYTQPSDLTDYNGLSGKILSNIKGIVPKVIIADGVTVIPAASFSSFKSLIEVELPDSLKQIGAQAFKNTNIKLLQLPKNLEILGSQAFANCASLHGTVRIPNSVIRIGKGCFEYCDNSLTLAIYKNRPEGSLHISQDDEHWFADHTKVIQAEQESLEEDFDYEALFEELLDEAGKTNNLPGDLVYAYRNVNSTGKSVNNETGHSHYAINNRRSVLYDYANSTYRVISNEEAHNLVKENKSNVKYLRLLYKKGQKNGYTQYGLVELEEVSPGELRPIYAGVHDITYTDRSGDLKSKSVTSCTAWQLIDNADKIYWTDEYDHRLSDDQLAARREKGTIHTLPKFVNSKLDSGEVNPDYDPHAEYSSAGKSDKYVNANVDTPDTGSHGKLSTYNYGENGISLKALNTLNEYKNYLNHYKELRNKYLKRKEILVKNKDLYDEDEYEEKLNNLNSYLKDATESYNKYRDLVIKQKKTVLSFFDESIADLRKKSIENGLLIEQKEKEYHDLKGSLEQLKAIDIQQKLKDTKEYEKISQAQFSLTSAKDALNNCKKQQESIEEQIKKLQEQLTKEKEKETGFTTLVNEAKDDLNAAYAGVDEVAEKLATEASYKIQEAKTKMKEIADWFEAQGIKHIDQKKEKELPDDVKSKVALDDTKTEMEDEKLCHEKFGLSLKEVIERCKKYEEKVLSTENIDDVDGLVNPFSGENYEGEINSLSGAYKYWNEATGVTETQIDEFIRRALRETENN